MLSIGGKEVLIKAFLQASPMYTMFCLLLPSSFCKELEAVIAKFWCQKKASARALHWCSWKELCVKE